MSHFEKNQIFEDLSDRCCEILMTNQIEIEAAGSVDRRCLKALVPQRLAQRVFHSQLAVHGIRIQEEFRRLNAQQRSSHEQQEEYGRSGLESVAPLRM
jgi:hypothetical protein